VPPALKGITLDRLKTEGPLRLNLPQEHAPFSAGNFTTPSGKCEFFSQTMADKDLDPLPAYLAPVESADISPELAQRFGLQLLTPPSPHFLNSSFVNVDSLRQSAKHPELDIHPDDAAVREIQHGDLVRIHNDRGEFEAVANVGHTVRPGVVVAPSVWWHKLTGGRGNANLTTSTRLTDFGGGATFFDNLVEVTRCSL
jgi:anaerobic selenocysteine-containing dehydrogenase